MRHPSAKSLTSEETTKIGRAINRILVMESLSHIPVNFKPNVWTTRYQCRSKTIEGVKTITEEYLQFGGKFLTGGSIPKNIYIVEYTDQGYKLVSYPNPMRAQLATIISSVILEEIVHAKVRQTNLRCDAHGKEFYQEFIRISKKHFNTLHLQMTGDYGYEGEY